MLLQHPPWFLLPDRLLKTFHPGPSLHSISLHNLTINRSNGISMSGSVTLGGTLLNSAGVSGLSILSDASGTGSVIHHSSSVSGTVERYYSGNPDEWNMISSPVANATADLYLGRYLQPLIGMPLQDGRKPT